MKALTFHFSYPRFVAGKLFGGLSRGGPLVYEDVPDAKLLGDDWVIVETRYCGICGSDVKQAYLEGAFDNPMTAVISFPHVLGHEVVGTVVEAGKDVRHVKKGDRVACYPWIRLPPLPRSRRAPPRRARPARDAHDANAGLPPGLPQRAREGDVCVDQGAARAIAVARRAPGGRLDLIRTILKTLRMSEGCTRRETISPRSEGPVIQAHGVMARAMMERLA